MDFINLLGSAWPANNFWATLIKLFDVGSYAWTIILFTVVLKLVLSPMDFLQRYFTNKTSRAQAKLQPQLAKLQKQYGQNQNLLMQKQNELYQKSGFSMKGSCIVMLVYMVTTLVVFFTLFSSLQFISGFKVKNQYNALQTVYNTNMANTYEKVYLEATESGYETFKTTAEEGHDSYADYLISLEQRKINDYFKVEVEKEEPTLAEEAVLEKATQKLNDKKATYQSVSQDLVVDKYLEVKDSWLWIKNIWLADKATTHEILTFKTYQSLTGDKSVDETSYNLVMAKLLNGEKDTNGVNGYYILSIIVVLLSFFSQWLTRKVSQPKDKSGKPIEQPMATKIMMFILPLTMLIFTLNSSAVFALYLIINSLMSTILTPIITVICNKIEDKKELKQQEVNRVDYRRY